MRDVALVARDAAQCPNVLAQEWKRIRAGNNLQALDRGETLSGYRRHPNMFDPAVAVVESAVLIIAKFAVLLSD